MPHLHIDCRQGMGGDMFLAAMADLGLGLAPLARAFAGAGLKVELDAPVVRVGGFAGRRLAIQAPGAQPMRHLPQIMEILGDLDVGEDVRERAVKAFERLARVEAAAHGIDVGDVHFHEVGAVDTLVDVVGAFWALGELGVERVTCSALPWFGGFVECEHGRLALPAPATLALLEGKPVFPTGYEVELLTPTGALVLDQVVGEFGVGGPCGVVKGTGRAFGTHDLGEGNCGVRVVLVEVGES